MPFITTNDQVQLYYRDWGTGRPAVFIHGWTVGGEMWEYQTNTLSEQGVRCIAYDQRGCGRSDDPGRSYDYDALADDLAALLNHLDLQEVTLVSHSMGSGVITRYLTRHGADRISKTVLIAPTTPCLLRRADNPDGLEQSVFDTVIAGVRTDRAAYLNSLVPGFVGEGLPGCDVSPEMQDWVLRLALQASPYATIAMVHTNSQSDLRAEMQAFTKPTLILHGDADQGNPIELTGSKTAALIPGSRLIVYENAPHGLFLTHRERINQDLLDFIRA